jgi:hypothetical protein
MNNKLIIFFILVACLGCLGLNGCAAKKPVYPSLTEIPPIPEYTMKEQNWNTDAICWVGMSEDAKWTWNLPGTTPQARLWVKNNTSTTLQELIREELQNAGYEVKHFQNEYITRKKRLAIEKMVFFQEYEIKDTLVKEGICYDMKLTVKAMDHPELELIDQCEVWGRCIVPNGETKPWKDVMKMCVKNLFIIPEFRQALVKNEAQ